MVATWLAPEADSALNPIRARYKNTLARLPAPVYQAGLGLLERISSVNWYLEWNLPRWLGSAYQVDPNTTDELVLANVYGLAYVRLSDDLMDGEAIPAGETQLMLAATLYQLWLAQYQPLFPNTSPFWRHLEGFITDWKQASVDDGHPAYAELHSNPGLAGKKLAARGALLKVCCVAALMFSAQLEDLPRLLDGMDCLLAGAVLLDHAFDWQADLDNGRYNALVAFISPISQVDHGFTVKKQLKQVVLEEFYLGEAAQPYFLYTQQQFQRAMDLIQGLKITYLEKYVAWAKNETAEYATRLAEGYRQRLQSATGQILRSTGKPG